MALGKVFFFYIPFSRSKIHPQNEEESETTRKLMTQKEFLKNAIKHFQCINFMAC